MTEPSSQSSALINCLKRAQSIPVSQLRFADFVQPALGYHGIYAFFAGDEYQITDERTGERIDSWYIGSVTSKAMVECVASHFVPCCQYQDSLLRQIAYTMARPEDKLLFSEENPTEKQKSRIEEIMEQCLPVMQSLRLRYILYEESVNEDLSDAIRADEQTLINHFQPAFNNLKEGSLELLSPTSNDGNSKMSNQIKNNVIMSKEEMKQQMELQLHEQYAQNNNSYFGSIVVLISALLAALGAYGYVFINTSDKLAENWNEYFDNNTGLYSLDVLLLAGLIATFVLALCFHICIYQGTAQRKEQFIIDFIRRKEYGVEKFDKDFEPFPKDYSPYGKKWNTFVQGLYWEFVKYIVIAEIILITSLGFHICGSITIDSITLFRCFIVLVLVFLVVRAMCVYCSKKTQYHEIEEYYKNNYLDKLA